ncbi:MAG: hypothetical protein KDD94_05735 [Calditrichaeota bacterium]|nr:hypothetical protein [Calditrichota bacterium]
MSDSFYLKPDTFCPIVLMGRGGKSICKSFLEAVFSDQIIVNKRLDRHLTSKEEIEKLLNLAKQENRPVLFDISSHLGAELTELAELINPKIIIITNIDSNHKIYNGKRIPYFELIREFLNSIKSDSILVLNKDDDLISSLTEGMRPMQLVKFGLNIRSDFFAAQIQQLGPQGISFKLNDSVSMTVPIYQFYQIYGILAALVVCRIFNIKLKTISERIEESFTVPRGKGNLVRIGNISIINDTHTNNEQSVTHAAQTLITFKNYSNRMIMVIDEMDMDTQDKKSLHLSMGHFLAALPIDVIITVGKHARYITDGIRIIPNDERIILNTDDVTEAVMNLLLIIEANDCILLKSGRNSGLTQFIKILAEKYKP